MLLKIVTTGITVLLLVVLFLMAYNNFAPKKEDKKVGSGSTVTAGEKMDVRSRSFNERYTMKEIDSLRAIMNYSVTRELAMANVAVREVPAEMNNN
jgi:hypothetical protein